jgi:hypothetical protein
MSLYSKRIPLRTSSEGTVSVDVRITGPLVAVDLQLGTLSTPDIEITDEPAGITLLDVAGVDADARWQLGRLLQGSDGEDLTVEVHDGDDGTSEVSAYAPPVVIGRVHIAVTGGGASKGGLLTLVFNR